MAILNALVNLFSGAMLLLFSVRFMRVGIERLWSARLRASVSEKTSVLSGLARGTGLGFVMQGATVVMLMAAGLAGAGAVPASAAAVVALGADMGSAFAVAFLQLPVSALGPLAILVGASLYLNGDRPKLRNGGRILLGLGLVFLSLSIIRATVEPIGSAPFTSVVAAYLTRDPVAAALAGIVLTLVMHSSVAAILTMIAIASHAVIGPAAAIGFVLGCNVGSALLPMWLLRHEQSRSRVVALTVAIIRLSMAAVLLVVLATTRGLIDSISISSSHTILGAHISFNLLLLPLAPLCRGVVGFLEGRTAIKQERSVEDLPAGLTEDPSLAAAAIKRKLSAMLEVASTMLNEATSPAPEKERMAELERQMNAGLGGIRDIYSHLATTDDVALHSIQQIVDFAIRVERCGDVLAGKFLVLRLDQVNGRYEFTEDGKQEISHLVDAVRRSLILAHETAWTSDQDAAERLLRHKQHVAQLEEQSRHDHLARLRRGNLTSLASSNQHLEIIAALKEINSKFATIAYAVLEQHGALEKTRLISRAAGNVG
jgi:phosphate:Na+ symporter